MSQAPDDTNLHGPALTLSLHGTRITYGDTPERNATDRDTDGKEIPGNAYTYTMDPSAILGRDSTLRLDGRLLFSGERNLQQETQDINTLTKAEASSERFMAMGGEADRILTASLPDKQFGNQILANGTALAHGTGEMTRDTQDKERTDHGLTAQFTDARDKIGLVLSGVSARDAENIVDTNRRITDEQEKSNEAEKQTGKKQPNFIASLFRRGNGYS